MFAARKKRESLRPNRGCLAFGLDGNTPWLDDETTNHIPDSNSTGGIARKSLQEIDSIAPAPLKPAPLKPLKLAVNRGPLSALSPTSISITSPKRQLTSSPEMCVRFWLFLVYVMSSEFRSGCVHRCDHVFYCATCCVESTFCAFWVKSCRWVVLILACARFQESIFPHSEHGMLQTRQAWGALPLPVY